MVKRVGAWSDIYCAIGALEGLLTGSNGTFTLLAGNRMSRNYGESGGEYHGSSD